MKNYKESNKKSQNKPIQNNNFSAISKSNNNFQNISQSYNYQQINNNYEIQINELKRQLKQEKEKNQILINENINLKNIINQLNIELNNIKGIKEKLQHNLTQKNKINEHYDLSSVNEDDKIIAVNFVSMERNDIGHFNLICKKRDLFVRLEERLYENFPQYKEFDIYFLVDGRRIKRFKTMEQNNINNNDIINLFIIDE